MTVHVSIGLKRNGEPAWLAADAAASFARMVATGCPDDGIIDAGRTYAEQLELWEAYQRGETPATAARPGTPEALHEKGLALDLRGATCSWVRLYGLPFGWVADTVDREPWHVVYDQARDHHREDDTMPTPQEIAAAVWAHPSPARPTVTMGQELADIKTKLSRWETDGNVPPATVERDGQPVPLWKEAVDTKTKVTRIEAAIARIEGAVS